jgi:hypothetical protein
MYALLLWFTSHQWLPSFPSCYSCPQWHHSHAWSAFRNICFSQHLLFATMPCSSSQLTKRSAFFSVDAIDWNTQVIRLCFVIIYSKTYSPALTLWSYCLLWFTASKWLIHILWFHPSFSTIPCFAKRLSCSMIFLHSLLLRFNILYTYHKAPWMVYFNVGTLLDMSESWFAAYNWICAETKWQFLSSLVRRVLHQRAAFHIRNGQIPTLIHCLT